MSLLFNFDSNKSLAKRKYYTQTRVNYTLNVFFSSSYQSTNGVRNYKVTNKSREREETEQLQFFKHNYRISHDSSSVAVVK